MAVGLDWYGEFSWGRYAVIQEGSALWVSTSSGNKGPESGSLQTLEAQEHDE